MKPNNNLVERLSLKILAQNELIRNLECKMRDLEEENNSLKSTIRILPACNQFLKDGESGR